jgi:UPF0716 protein FxsA
VQTQLGAGEMPAESLLDGLMILIASALLVTPGVLTDVFGFLCLTPAFRNVVKREVVSRFKRSIEEGNVKMNISFRQQGGAAWQRDPREPMIDVTPKTPKD